MIPEAPWPHDPYLSRTPSIPCADGCPVPGLGRCAPGTHMVCPSHACQNPGSLQAGPHRLDRLCREALVGCQGL